MRGSTNSAQRGPQLGWAALTLTLLVVFAPAAGAAVFNVNAGFDDVDVDPGDGSCATEGQEYSVCTLRAAIMEANALPGVDTVLLPPGTYSLTLFGPFDNNGAVGDLDVLEPLVLAGAGRHLTFIDATGLGDRVLDLLTPAVLGVDELPNQEATVLSGITLTGGNSPSTKGPSPGGAGIRNLTELELIACAIVGNSAAFAFGDSGSYQYDGGDTGGGGGVLNLGTLLASESDFSSNDADDSESGGGGLLNLGTATLVGCTISDNSAEDVHGGGGGGIANLGTLTLERCEVSGNSADDSGRGGGGLLHDGSDLTIVDSVLSGNRADVAFQNCGAMAGGGGLSVFADSVFVARSTISDNATRADCEGQPEGGGGVYAGAADDLFFVNTTISGNEASGALHGGGAFLCVDCASAFHNCTIAENSVVADESFPSSQFGAGLSVVGSGSVAYENTIVLGNFRYPNAELMITDDCAADLLAAFASGGYNLLGGGSDCAADWQTDVVIPGSSTSGVLGPLADNGGPTATHALVPGSSPAIDAANPVGCTFDDAELLDQPLSVDQRGRPRPADGDHDSLAVCDIGAYELSAANPPDCSRLIQLEGSTHEVRGLATDDDRAADTGIFDVDLTQADGVVLLPLDFVPGDPQVTFTVQCIDATPEDGSCEGSGVVVVTDGEGLTCTLGIDFTAVPAGPLQGFPICAGDGTLLQVTNPAAGSSDPPTPAGTGACSANELGDDDPPLPPGYAPVPECDVFTIESPIAGETEMVYKVEINNVNLRLLFSEFDESTGQFLGWEDITLSVELIPQVVPDPTRLEGKHLWSPVKVTCAELVPVDCGDPAHTDLDQDGDGYSPCPSPGNPNQSVDCDDHIPFANPGAVEQCNGMDDNCNGLIDDGFDLDADTVADCFDNCLGLANPPEICDPELPPFQCDADMDGIGDACDDDDDEGDDEGDDEADDEMDDEIFDGGGKNKAMDADPPVAETSEPQDPHVTAGDGDLPKRPEIARARRSRRTGR